MRPITFLVAMITVAVILSTTNATFDGWEWEPIKNLKDEHVKEIAEYAVEAYNMISNSFPIQLVKIKKGKIRYAGGTNYKLVVAAVVPETGNMVKLYETVVHENIFYAKKLVYFRQLFKSAPTPES
ncbi:unnamed protein product [Linum tenue]|uniref:Cystatin domain-containing protein n=1 Tax=Linum tenue TaxID=586396 RepID=A0AAV0RLR4_9ROSI|nr:unnamed protein product [Linum tenue]